MATIKQATNSVLDGIVISTVALGATTREVAGTVVDTAKQTRKLVNVVGSTIDYAKVLMDKELTDLQLDVQLDTEILTETYADEAFRKKAKEAKRKILLARYEEPAETDFNL